MKILFDKTSIDWVLNALEIKLPKNIDKNDIILISKDKIIKRRGSSVG